MCLEKLPPFGKMLIGSIGGALLGIAFGLILSLLIAWISIRFSAPDFQGPGSEYSLTVFLGMGAGTIVGAILGGIAVLKK